MTDFKDVDADALSPVGKIKLEEAVSGYTVYKEFEEMLRDDPAKRNEDFLMQLLQDNKDTEYGKKYNFADIHSIKDYQKNVPVTRYDDYAEYILRMTENGESNLICAYPVNHYNKSSGTMGNPKKIPMSDKALDIFMKYITRYFDGYVWSKLGDASLGGKTMAITESAIEIPRLKCGATYSAVSVKWIDQLRKVAAQIYSSPSEALFPAPNTNTRYLHARFALMDKDIVGATATFYSFFLELMRYIENNWQMLVDDIENGTIDMSVKLSDEARESLLKKIEPMPERAAQLREIFKQGFDEPFMPKVWPKMSFLGGIGTGGFKAYADRLKSYMGNDIIQMKWGLVSSEGVFSVIYENECEDTVVIPDSIFYEFLPLDAGDDFSKIVTMADVEIGKDYELIISNCSGLYRYRMRDAVRITGKHHNAPTIQFLYRIDQTVSIMGEKTTEVALRSAAENTAKELGFELIDFSMYPDLDAKPARYLFFMEIGKQPEGLRPKEIRFVLEQKLAEANPSMGDKVAKGICGPTKLNFLEPETYMLYRDLMISKGAASGQLKPVRIINNEIQRRFFFGLTEYGVEVVK